MEIERLSLQTGKRCQERPDVGVNFSACRVSVNGFVWRYLIPHRMRSWSYIQFRCTTANVYWT